MPLAELTATVVLSAGPWRTVRSHRGQKHLPGMYWSATTGGHVVYESRLELARLLLADFDSEVVGIAAQPLLVRDANRRHVPDFLLRRADGSVLIVNVKPPDRMEDERVADALGWAGSVFAERGWGHEVWGGADAQLLANVRFPGGLSASGAARAWGRRRGDLEGGDGGDDRRRGGSAVGRRSGRSAAGRAWSGVVGAAASRPAASIDRRDRIGGAVVSVACLAVGSRVAYAAAYLTIRVIRLGSLRRQRRSMRPGCVDSRRRAWGSRRRSRLAGRLRYGPSTCRLGLS